MRASMMRPRRRNPYDASVGQTLLAFFAPSLGGMGMAPAAAPAALPPGMKWLQPPFKEATIAAIATAACSYENATAANTFTEPGAVLAFYSGTGQRKFYQRITTTLPYFLPINVASGDAASPLDTLHGLLTPNTLSYLFPGGTITAVLYLGDADYAGDDPDAMLELLNKAPQTAVGAPPVAVPFDLQLLADKVMALVPGSFAVVPPSDAPGVPHGSPEVKDESLGLTLHAWFFSATTNVKMQLYIGTDLQGDYAYFSAPLPVTLTPAFYDSTAQFFADEMNEFKAKKSLGPLSLATDAQAAAAEVAAAKPAKTPKTAQTIKSLAAAGKTLAPLVKKAVAKVAGVTVETKTGGWVTLTKGTASVKVASVTSSGVGGDDLTLEFNDPAHGVSGLTKHITVAVPDTLGNVATTIAQAMVYFLVYTARSHGKEHVAVPNPLPVAEVDGVAILPGTLINTANERYALPNTAYLIPAPAKNMDGIGEFSGIVYTKQNVPLPAVLAYLPVEDWDDRYAPLDETPYDLAKTSVIIPAPKHAGWPATQFAPTLAAYTSLPVGTLIRTEVGTSTVYAVRESTAGYRKIDPSTGAFSPDSTTVRSPAKLDQDTLYQPLRNVFAVYVGKGTVEDPALYLKWLGGMEADKADVLATAAVEQVTELATALGIDPRVAALFTPAVLQVMLAQQGISYQGKTFAPPKPMPSPLLANPSRHRAAVRDVLGNPSPTMRDLQDAELLEAAGLPLHDCLPRRRNPKGGATSQEMGVIKGVTAALKAALGSGKQPKLASPIVQTINARLKNMYDHGDDSYGLAADKMSRPEYAQLAQFLRYLVAARVLGLWKNYIDPGERSVTRALGVNEIVVNDPTQSLRPNAVTQQQIALLKGAGLLSTPTTLLAAANTWLRKQATGHGWYRPDVNAKWVASHALTPPYTANLPSLTNYQTQNIFQAATAMQTIGEYDYTDTWQGPKPYPAWAGEPWANVEGLCLDYYDQTFKQYVISEWSAPLFGFTGPSAFQVRANTRDPRFVLLPGTVLGQGPMKKYRSEGAVLFVTIDDKFPLKAEIITTGSLTPGSTWDNRDWARLTDEQLIAWGLARPAFPSGPKPTAASGPAFAMPTKTNPRSVNAREVHALLFSRSKWGPGAVRSWLAKNGMEGLNVEAAGGAWRVGVYAADAFHPGSIQRRAVADGVVILAGRPL